MVRAPSDGDQDMDLKGLQSSFVALQVDHEAHLSLTKPSTFVSCCNSTQPDRKGA